MLQIYNFDDWKIYDGLSAGSGRSEKKWLQSDDGRIGLFKFPKVDVLGNVSSTEYVSEHIASRIGLILGIPTASIDTRYTITDLLFAVISKMSMWISILGKIL